MSSTFKCLVEINGQKFSIFINDYINDIKFSEVLTQIQKIDSKLNITFETHLFEIYDSDFDEFVVIKSEEQIIKCLSRIRVLAKHKINDNFKPINNNNELIANKNDFIINIEDIVNTNPLLKSSKLMIGIKNNTSKTSETELIQFQSNIDNNPFRKHFINNELTTSSTKRLLDGNENYFINNSFPKRIKKVNEINCESKPINTSKTDQRLNDSSSQTIVNPFSQLSLSITENDLPLPSTSYEDISEDIKQLTISDEKNISNKKSKKRNKFKSKKKKKLKLNTKSNLFIEKSKIIVINRIKSDIIKELKVTIYKSHTQEEVNSLLSLRNEGIVLKQRKKGELFKCLFCLRFFQDMKSAEDHSQGNNHIMNKTEQKIKGFDRLLVSDINSYNDIEVLLARKQELSKISPHLKDKLHKHGIKLKNGFGINAYVCLKCELSFESLIDVKLHVEYFDKELKESALKNVGLTNVNNTEQNINLTKDSFKNEGIIYRNIISDGRNVLQLYCLFCELFFNNEKTAIDHLNESIHKITKRGENFGAIEEKFIVNSERVDEFEIAIARKKTLTLFGMKKVKQYTEEGIRLKDGIGSHAFICQTCGISIELTKTQFAIKIVRHHIRSDLHISNKDFQQNANLDLNKAINELKISSDS